MMAEAHVRYLASSIAMIKFHRGFSCTFTGNRVQINCLSTNSYHSFLSPSLVLYSLFKVRSLRVLVVVRDHATMIWRARL